MRQDVTHTILRELKRQQKKFEEVVEEYKRVVSEISQPRHGLTGIAPLVSAHTSWDDVLEEVENAKLAWERKAQGGKGLLTRFHRSHGTKAALIPPWLELLPQSDYSSVVCGGLKLILGVRDS